jgi:hypothetical protein
MISLNRIMNHSTLRSHLHPGYLIGWRFVKSCPGGLYAWLLSDFYSLLSSFFRYRRTMAGGPFPYKLNVNKNKFCEVCARLQPFFCSFSWQTIFLLTVCLLSPHFIRTWLWAGMERPTRNYRKGIWGKRKDCTCYCFPGFLGSFWCLQSMSCGAWGDWWTEIQGHGLKVHGLRGWDVSILQVLYFLQARPSIRAYNFVTWKI